jgi:UDP-glucose 4-epimerase
MQVLVVGGAGYIGSHMLRCLGKAGIDATTLDNLSSGRRDAVTHGDFVEGDLGDRALLDDLLGKAKFDGVMHFAAHIEVGESVFDPGKYYRNNVVNTQVLLDIMREHRVMNFIFSSTAAIFGEPVQNRIDESHPKNPINPYGRSKLMVEQILGDYDSAYGLKSVCLRYFNAAGADPAGDIGECHDPETHLVPLVLRAASGRRENISVFGTDYETLDGTCVRDYIHVHDLCDAHLLALRKLWDGSPSAAYNLGNGNGFSVREVIDTAIAVTGCDIAVVEADRRAGDPGTLVADSTRAKTELGWQPQYADLATIVEHAWQWEQVLANE